MKDLGLPSLAERHLGFLVSNEGYEHTESMHGRVRFESRGVFVELLFDGSRSYELELMVGRKGSEEPPFYIDEILRLRSAPEAESFSLVQITTADAMAVWVERLAKVLRVYGHDFIAGDERAFADLETQRHTEAQRYALERDLEAARAEARAAWARKDYAAVVEVLKPLRTALTPSEAGKLAYAEKHRDR